MVRLRAVESRPQREERKKDRLDSWKEIASYLDRGVRTVQRWEREEGLPVHRLTHGKGSSVYALPQELDEWWSNREEPLEGVRSRISYPIASGRRRACLIAGIGLFVGAASAVIWYWASGGSVPKASPQLVQLTSFRDEEWVPRFNPDASQVVFAKGAEGPCSADLYIADVLMRRSALWVQADEVPETCAAWSPDGKHIAFLRLLENGVNAVMLADYLRVSEEQLAEVNGPTDCNAAKALVDPALEWSPDGKWLVAVHRETPEDPYALFAISLETTEKRRLTDPPAGWFGDAGAAFSPDGRTLAFHRFQSAALSEIFLISLSEGLEPEGGPIQLTDLKGFSGSPEFTRDGKEILFSHAGSRRYLPYLCRIRAKPGSEPQNIDYIPVGAHHPEISNAGDRLVFSRLEWFTDIYQIELERPGKIRGGAERLISSTGSDLQAEISPDGHWIIFSSSRSGSREIWKCNRDGSDAIPLTESSQAYNYSPAWDPTGTLCAYCSDKGGNRDIYVMDRGGRNQTRLTTHPADDNTPSWSLDGKWVYFTSKRTGSWEIWKAAADGGSVEQVTTGGGWSPEPSRDGERLFFMRGPLDQAAIWQIDLDSGENREILSSNLAVDQMAVAATGLYYIPKPDQENRRFIWYFDFDAGEQEIVGELEGPLLQCALCMDWEKAGFSVSPDGKYLLFGQVEEFDSNLFVVENFR